MFTAYLQKLRLFSRDVRLFLISWALVGFTLLGIYSVLFNLYLLRLGYGPKFVGLVNAAGWLAFVVFSLPAGALGGRWGSRLMMIVGVSLTMVGLVLLPLGEFVPKAYRMGWLVVTYVLAWLGGPLYVVNGAPFLMGATGPGERSHAFSVQAALFPLSGFAGNLVGGLLPGLFATTLGLSLGDPAPYRYPLLIAAVPLIPGVLVLLATREVSIGHTEETAAEAGATPLGLIALVAVVSLLGAAGDGVVLTFFNVYLDAGLSVPTAQIGAMLAASQLLVVPAALSMPLLAARWGGGRTIFGGSLGMAISLLPLALIPHWGAAVGGFVGVRALSTIRNPAINVYGMEMVTPGWRAAMSGATTMAIGLSSSIIAFGGGYIIAALGYRSLFLTGAGLTAAGALLFWAYFLRTPRGEFARRLALEEVK